MSGSVWFGRTRGISSAQRRFGRALATQVLFLPPFGLTGSPTFFKQEYRRGPWWAAGVVAASLVLSMPGGDGEWAAQVLLFLLFGTTAFLLYNFREIELGERIVLKRYLLPDSAFDSSEVRHMGDGILIVGWVVLHFGRWRNGQRLREIMWRLVVDGVVMIRPK